MAGLTHIGASGEAHMVDVGEKAEATTIDSEDRHSVRRSEAGGMQHRAVSTHCDDQVDARAQIALGNPFDTHVEIDGRRSVDAYLSRP